MTTVMKMNVVQLKAEAKARGLKGYSKMRKADLLELLMKNGVLSNHDDLMNFNDGVPNIVNKIESKSVKELQKIAKARGLKGYSKMRKADLLENVENINVSILNEPVPDINVPMLAPTLAATVPQKPELYDRFKKSL
jgi:transcription termination factor Rho